jgi:hypothetical protein
MRMVRRISLGMTTRPRSSMRRTIPVAFIYNNPPAFLSVVTDSICRRLFVMQARADETQNWTKSDWAAARSKSTQKTSPAHQISGTFRFLARKLVFAAR